MDSQRPPNSRFALLRFGLGCRDAQHPAFERAGSCGWTGPTREIGRLGSCVKTIEEYGVFHSKGVLHFWGVRKVDSMHPPVDVRDAVASCIVAVVPIQRENRAHLGNANGPKKGSMPLEHNRMSPAMCFGALAPSIRGALCGQARPGQAGN